MRHTAALLLFLEFAGVSALSAQGLISESEINERTEQNQSEIIPHRDLLYNPLTNSEATEDPIDPVMEQDVYLDSNIQESPQLAVDRVFDLIPFPNLVTFNTLDPDKGYTRADYQKWDVEARADTSYGYDNNINNSAVNRDASQIATVGGGVQARLGSIRPNINTGDFTSKYAVVADYDIAADDYLDHPSANSVNQQFQLRSRIGRDTFILTPYVQLADVTSLPVIDPDRLGLVRERRALAGSSLNWTFQRLNYTGDFTAAAIQHPDPGLIDGEAMSTHQEIGYTLNRLSRAYTYGEFRNFYPTEGSYYREFEEGIGFDYVDNDLILDRFRWKTRVGIAQPDYNNNPREIRSNAGFRMNMEIGEFFTPNWEWIVRLGRAHEIDSTLPDNAFLNDYANVTVRWRPTPALGVGVSYGLVRTLFDDNNQAVFLQQVSLQVNYTLSYHAIAFARASYSHSTTAEVEDPDVVGVRESVGIEFRF